MLKIGINEYDHISGSVVQARHDGVLFAEVARELNKPDGITRTLADHCLRGAILATVVDDNDFVATTRLTQ